MFVKRLFVFFIFMMCLVTMLVQMLILGSDEEMVETEYAEYQIHFDFQKMEDGLSSLFGLDSQENSTSGPILESGDSDYTGGGKRESGTWEVSPAKAAPTARPVNGK